MKMYNKIFEAAADYLVENNLLQRNEISETTRIEDTGMDSLDLYDFIISIEERLGIVLEETLFDYWTNKTTLDKICKDFLE